MTMRSAKLLLVALAIPIFWFAPHVAHAIQIPQGKTATGAVSCITYDTTENGPLPRTTDEEGARNNANGTCTVNFTDGTSLVETFGTGGAADLQVFSAPNGGGNPVGAAQHLTAQQSYDQAAADAKAKADQVAADPNATDAQKADAAQAATQEAKNASEAAGTSCGISSGAAVANCFQGALSWIIEQIALLFLRFANFLVYLGGAALNWVIYVTIFQFGNIVGNNGGLLAAWGVLRDIGNILLLFGFIFMGISTILNLPGNEFTAKRALPTFIIFAVLMNFSLFAAEAVIDVSNAFGVTFYKQAVTSGCAQGIDDKTCATNYGISASVMQISGLSHIFDKDTQDLISKNNDSTARVMIYLGLCIFAMVTAFIFFAAAFMFIARMVVLAIVMVTSPIGFAGMAVPPLHEAASTWWKTLLNQAFFAPIYILLVLISVQFMKGITTALSQGGNLSGSNLVTVFSVSGQSSFTIFIIFCLVMGFMLAAVVVAQQMGAAGSKFATARAAGFTAGSVAFIGRRSIGQGAFRASHALRGSAFGDTFVGRQLLKATDYGSKASFDARGIGAVKQAAQGQHIDLGNIPKNAQHGFEGIAHGRAEDIKKHAEKMTLSEHDRHEHLRMRLANRELEREIGHLRLEMQEAVHAHNDAERQRLQDEIDDREHRVRENRLELNRLDRSLFVRRRDFANRLENDWISRTAGRATGGRVFDEEGVHEIREYLAKSPREKLVDDLRRVTEQEEEAQHQAGNQQNQGQQNQGHGPAAH